MIGVSDHLVSAVRATLASGGSGMLPITGMDNHFCSLENGGEDKSQFKLLFPLEVDHQKVFIYLKI